MDPASRKTATDILLVSISVSTGWKLPNEPLLSLLQNEFMEKLEEDYLSLTPAEIKYAFRNASQVKNWGLDFNLNLLDQVLSVYINRRAEVRKTYASLPMAPDDPGEVSEEQELQFNKQTYGYWKIECSEGVKLKYIPSSLFDIILKIDQVEPSQQEVISCLGRARKSILFDTEQELKAIDGEVKPGQYNALKLLRDKLNSEKVDDWQFLSEIQKLGKAMWCVDYFNKKSLQELKNL